MGSPSPKLQTLQPLSSLHNLQAAAQMHGPPVSSLAGLPVFLQLPLSASIALEGAS